MCRTWAAGGLHLKPTHLINESLILQLAWKLISEKSQWTLLLQKRFFSNGKPIQRYFKSSVWCGIKTHIPAVITNSFWLVGTGDNIHFWTDNWLSVPLVDLLQIDPITHINFSGSLSGVIVDGDWNIPAEVLVDHGVATRLGFITLPRAPLSDLLL